MFQQIEFTSQASAEIEQAGNWIPATLTPENKNHDASDLVLVCVKIKHLSQPRMLIAYFDFRRGQWRTTMGKIDCGEVTHWRELPAPPAQEPSPQAAFAAAFPTPEIVE